MKSSSILLTTSTFASVFLGAMAAAQTVIIDDFAFPASPGQILIQDGLGTSSDLYTLNGGFLLGGSRGMSLTITADQGTQASASVNGPVANKLAYENGSGVASILTLTYNANGVGLAQNWSLLEEITFLVDVADQNGTATIELFASSNFTGPSFASHMTPIPPIAVSDTPFMASFADFDTFGGFDFSTVNSIRISLEGPDAYDMVVHQILASNVVPEASTVVPLAGMFVGVGALLFRRRSAARARVAAV